MKIRFTIRDWFWLIIVLSLLLVMFMDAGYSMATTLDRNYVKRQVFEHVAYVVFKHRESP